jgi:uncharacterized protein YjiS (DUF1127 family)
VGDIAPARPHSAVHQKTEGVMMTAEFLRRLADLVRAYADWRWERQQLLALGDRELRDMGITRIDAERAAGQRFRWR